MFKLQRDRIIAIFVTCILMVGLHRAYQPALVASLIAQSHTLLNLLDGLWWDEVALKVREIVLATVASWSTRYIGCLLKPED